MADIDAVTQVVAPAQSLVQLAHIVYGLHAFSAVIRLPLLLLLGVWVLYRIARGWVTLAHDKPMPV